MKKMLFLCLFLSSSFIFAEDTTLENGSYHSPDYAGCVATMAGGKRKLGVSLKCGGVNGTFTAAKVSTDLYRYCESRTYCYNFEIVSSTSFIAYGTKNGSVIGNKLLYILD